MEVRSKRTWCATPKACVERIETTSIHCARGLRSALRVSPALYVCCFSKYSRAASGENLYDEWQKNRARKWHEEVEKKWNSLSKRERQVLRLLADGLSNKDVSSKLSITVKTLDKHLEKIYQKLGVASRTEAVLWGKENVGDFPY